MQDSSPVSKYSYLGKYFLYENIHINVNIKL